MYWILLMIIIIIILKDWNQWSHPHGRWNQSAKDSRNTQGGHRKASFFTNLWASDTLQFIFGHFSPRTSSIELGIWFVVLSFILNASVAGRNWARESTRTRQPLSAPYTRPLTWAKGSRFKSSMSRRRSSTLFRFSVNQYDIKIFLYIRYKYDRMKLEHVLFFFNGRNDLRNRSSSIAWELRAKVKMRRRPSRRPCSVASSPTPTRRSWPLTRILRTLPSRSTTATWNFSRRKNSSQTIGF